MSLEMIGQNAKRSASLLNNLDVELISKALFKISELLRKNENFILEANQEDLLLAKEAGIAESLLDRLTLTHERIEAMADGVLEVLNLPSPIGEVVSKWNRPNGLSIEKRRVPLGVIAIIYEARPNVTVDAAILCLKTQNAVILRGGKEAIHSNIALAEIMREALAEVGLPKDAIQIIRDTDRATASALMKMTGYVDVLIPRGGAGLIRSVVENSTVPVIETGTGNCHVYVDEFADEEMGVNIIVNAKVSRPSVCNAAETLLVHKNIAPSFLPKAIQKLRENHVEIRGCREVQSIVPDVILATETDWETEYGDYVLAVKVVDSLDEAIHHINRYNTGHSEAIVTESSKSAETFLQEVDAAAVYVNASTRFTDGNEFGFGAEIGISTQKIHARGPMGLSELTTTKYVVFGNGQIR